MKKLNLCVEVEKPPLDAAGERILQKIRDNDSVTATYYLAVSFKVNQSANAGKPRQDDLQKAIIAILKAWPKARPKATPGDILKALPGRFRIDDESIEWEDDDGEPHSAMVSGLRGRVSRARKAIASS